MQLLKVQRCGFLSLDLASVFCKLEEPSHAPHWIIFVFKIHAICLKLPLMHLKEVMIRVFNEQPAVLDEES